MAETHPEVVKISEHYNYLKEIFPEANTNTLLSKCIEFGLDEEAFFAFVEKMLDDPSTLRVGYDDEHVLSEEAVDKGADYFDVESFLKSLRTWDPVSYFDNLPKSEAHKQQILQYLKKRFCLFSDECLETVMKEKSYNLLHIVHEIINSPPLAMDLERVDDIRKVTLLCTNFINEVKYVENFDQIQEFLSLREEIRLVEKREGNTLECECCYADDILKNEVMTCSEGHIFCDNCIKKYVEVKLGEAKLTFPCLNNCAGIIPLTSIKEVISIKAYSKLCAKIQESEIKAANIPGIEFCSSCEYAVIPGENDPYFVCQGCGIKICRSCNKEDHTPLKCGENKQEYKEKLIRLTSEENATNIILRKCTTCKCNYIKEGGCNVMTCDCGTKLCYLCSQVLSFTNPYDHRCPTW